MGRRESGTWVEITVRYFIVVSIYSGFTVSLALACDSFPSRRFIKSSMMPDLDTSNWTVLNIIELNNEEDFRNYLVE